MPINPLGCAEAYAPIFYLGKPGALTAIKMPDADYDRTGSDGFESHSLLEGRAASRSPYLLREWSLSYKWLYPDAASLLYEYATRQRGVGPFVFHDPHTKNKLTANQASGTDSIISTEGFAVSGSGEVLSSSTAWAARGERSLLWSFQLPDDSFGSRQIYDLFERTASSSWGNLDSGQTWTVTGGAAADFLVTGGAGVMVHTNLDQSKLALVSSNTLSASDQTMLFSVNTLPTGDSVFKGIVVRYNTGINYYRIFAFLQTAGTVQMRIDRISGGVSTTIAPLITVPLITFAANTQMYMRVRDSGGVIQGKLWLASAPQPSTWIVQATDVTFPTGLSGIVGFRSASNTNSPVPRTMVYQYELATIGGDGNGGAMHLVAPTGYRGWVGPSGATWAFSGQIRAYQSGNFTVQPRLQFYDINGTSLSVATGSSIGPVTGSSTSFCLTGTQPANTAFVDVLFVLTSSTLITAGSGVLFDELQLELGDACTSWEYGDGQPLVSVRVSSENVPRVRRGTLAFALTEVSE